MEEQVQRLVTKAWDRFEQIEGGARLLISIAGIPGSGKTKLADAVTKRLNVLQHSPDVAICVPMDGYHLTRAQLSAMPDPEEAHARRGAAFTFDAAAFVALVEQLRPRRTAETGTIMAPSFDHKLKDPVADDIAIPAYSRIVIFEGNYLSMQKGEWGRVRQLVDEAWFVEVDEQVARERLARRHVAAGIVDSIEKGRERADRSDLVNGREILADRGVVDEVVVSVEDDEWKPEAQAKEGQ